MNKLDNLHGFGYRKVDEHARSACSCRSLRPDYCSFAPYHGLTIKDVFVLTLEVVLEE